MLALFHRLFDWWAARPWAAYGVGLLAFLAWFKTRDLRRDRRARRDERRDITHEIREATHASEDRADTAERRVARELDGGPDSLSERAGASPLIRKPDLRPLDQ